MIRINPQKIVGNWHSGVALDLHTISSTIVGTKPSGQPEFDNTYSEIGKLLNQLKYKHDQSAAKPIIDAAVRFLHPHFNKFNLIVPVPPSTVRAVQPVLVLARGIGLGLGLPVEECVTKARATPALKGIEDATQRRQLLEGAFLVDATRTAGRHVLIFDDLFRSGATMNAITDLLKADGGVASVRVLTITRTRSNR